MAIWRGNREALAYSMRQDGTIFPDMLWDLTATSNKIIRGCTERAGAEREKPMGCVANEPEQALWEGNLPYAWYAPIG